MSKKAQHLEALKLGGTFPGIIRDRQWERLFDQYRIFPEWQMLVDSDTAAHARPLKVVKDVLWLEVDNSAWMQQLRFQKLFLLETLNKHLRISHYVDIRLTLRSGGPESQPKQDRPAASIRFVPPPPEQVAAFKDQIGFIEDAAVRESLLHFWYMAHACRRE